MTTPPAGWDGILAEGETILWQGRPAGGIVWADLLSPETAIGMIFTLFSSFWLSGVYWMTDGFSTGGPVVFLFPLVGGVFLCIGLFLLVGRLFWEAYLRGVTWYTLTNKAAYVATARFGKRRLKRYDAADMTSPSLDDAQPGSVWFAREIRSHTTRPKGRMRRTRHQTVKIGFRRIPDARRVYRLLIEHTEAAKDA